MIMDNQNNWNPRIHILWDSRVPLGLSGPTTEELATVLNYPLLRIDGITFPLEGFDPSRNQFDALKILMKMDRFRDGNPDLFKREEMDYECFRSKQHICEKFLLITSGDLFYDLKSFVFGLSDSRLGVAVVSTTRLDNFYYGDSNNDLDYTDTIAITKHLVTECAHEIAHLFGLEHCDNPQCIMYCPNNLDDLDRKNESFCGRCMLELSERIGGGC